MCIGPERNKSFIYLPVTLKLHSIASRSFPIYSAGWREATNELERVNSAPSTFQFRRFSFFSPPASFLVLICGLYPYRISRKLALETDNNQNAKLAKKKNWTPFYTLYLLLVPCIVIILNVILARTCGK